MAKFCSANYVSAKKFFGSLFWSKKWSTENFSLRTGRGGGTDVGGTDVVTVTTSFSEAIPATGAPAASIRWDGSCGDAYVDATAAGTVISGSTVTTTHTLSASGTKFVVGTSCVDYTTAIKDVAGNALAADEGNVAGLG